MITLEALAAVILSLTAVTPIESAEERATRASSIATDILHATGGERGMTGALVGVAWHETNFHPDVDLGRCALHPKWCDGGHAVTLWQIHTRDHVLFEQLRTDRSAAAELAAKRIRSSFKACAKYDRVFWMVEYAVGLGCESLTGRAISPILMSYIDRAVAKL